MRERKKEYIEQRQKRAKEIALLAEHNTMGKDVYIRLHQLMLLRPKAQFWKPEEENSKENIVQGNISLTFAPRTTMMLLKPSSL